MDEPLPESEAALLTVLFTLPYLERTGYALRLVNAHRDNPALLSLIQELLSTTLLPAQVPFPGEKQGNGFITLLFPQSTASKRFFQREIGIVMASALDQHGIPFLLDAIVHPSTAGKSRAITACVSCGATDMQLVEVYQKSVPATQKELCTAMTAAGRVNALKILHLWEESPVEISEPLCTVLERELQGAMPQDRDAIWTRAGLSSVRLHRHLHNPKYVQGDTKADLITTLFNLLELYPPRRLTHLFSPSDVPSIPSSLERRMYSFLKHDLPRTLRLVRKTCHTPVPTHMGEHMLKLPTSFIHEPSSARFWHKLSLEMQTKHLLPFITELMQMHDYALLKNGQLVSADLLRNARWQIVVGLADNALASLEDAQIVQSMPEPDRNGIVAFVVHAIDVLVSRLHNIAHREDRSEPQMEIEHALEELLRRSVERIMAAFQFSKPSEEEFVKSFKECFILPLLKGSLKQYPPLAELLFDNIKGLFDITLVSRAELVLIATQFFVLLETNTQSVFDIPNDGIVQPYCGIRKTDNDAVFHLLLLLEPPKDNPSFYVNSILEGLSSQQREIIWAYFADPDYVYSRLFGHDGAKRNLDVFVKIITELPGCPRTRLHIVKGLLDHPEIEDDMAAHFYPLLDICDTSSREVLQKNTYKRLFVDRYQAYEHLLIATWAQNSPAEYIKTMKFLIPRIRNEIQPDAQGIPEILDINGVGDVLQLFDHASDDEVKKLAELYLSWEKQNNEAVSRASVNTISDYILTLANSALTRFAGSPAHPFFHFGMDLLWIREVFEKGSSKAHETYSVDISMDFTFRLTEDEELQRRRFALASKDALGHMGYWRVEDEKRLVGTLLEQYRMIHRTLPFENSTTYPKFISHMLDLLGIRWSTVPSLCEYTERQLDVLRSIAGSKEAPADWNEELPREAVQHILRLRALYHDSKVAPETLAWWSEFRHLRLFSTDASVEINLLHAETFDSDGRQNLALLDKLVEKLLDIDDTAVYLGFVRVRLMENRQDILKDSHITEASVGLFNQLPKDSIPRPPPWDIIKFPRRLYPHQCQIFAAELLKTIHSKEVSLRSQVTAAEQLTRLPSTTVIELAELLKEDLNPRVEEAILMFLPRLDEPASGIQFLLAPTYLNGELARTVAFSVRNSLQHVPEDSVPKVLLPAFPPENSGKLLKITVMKELVRLVCEHISHKEHQNFLMTLWKRKLHQDVRIALLKSVISFLGSKQENLAWAILRDAVSNAVLVLDDALFALLAVHPTFPGVEEFDVHKAHITDPDILTDMAINTIPDQCHDSYAEDILFPLTQLSPVAPKSFPKVNEKEAKAVRKRLFLLQQSAFHAIFSRFVRASNAHTFAQRGLDAAQSVAFSDAQDADLFPYFVYGIGKCVALDAHCWEILCRLVDFLAKAVDSPAKEPTKTSVTAVQRLHAMKLGSNMTFQRPAWMLKQLMVDRMSLLEPLVRHGCDHFATTFWERRFCLFSVEYRMSYKGPRGTGRSELDEARSLQLELIRLSAELQYDLTQLKSKNASLIDAASPPVSATLVEDLLSGSHGLGDTLWINELRLLALSRRLPKSHYAQCLSAFQTQVSNYHMTFYAQHWQELENLLESVLKEVRPDSEEREVVTTLLDPILARAGSSALDSHILSVLLEAVPDVILRYYPQWVLETVDTTLSSLRSWEVNNNTCQSVIQLVQIVNTTSILGNPTAHSKVKPFEFSPWAGLVVEAIHCGSLRNFDMAGIISSIAIKTQQVLMYPFSVAKGGDAKDRESKSTVAQLLNRYQTWNATHASQYLSGTRPRQVPPSVLVILKEILGRFPQLTVVHPSLFLSYAALTFSQSHLDSKTRTESVLSHLKGALTPQRKGQSSIRWAWAPPLSLTLSFAHVLFTETANEVADIVLDDCTDTGSHTCKLAALQLLGWWANKFYDAPDRDMKELVKTMEQDERREDVMRQYDELRLLACRDESRVVRERAFTLRAGDSLNL